MDPFLRSAAMTIARDTGLVAFTGGVLMVASSVSLPLCFAVGASVALLFSLASLIRAVRLTDDRLIRSEPWRTLEPEQRPIDALGMRRAREGYQRLLLHGAKSAAANAIVLFAASLIVSFAARLSSKPAIEVAWLG